MSDLLLRAKTKILVISQNIQYIGDSDYAIAEEVCFDLQQLVEFTLKHLCEINSVKYPRTHDISVLLRLVEPFVADCEYAEELKKHAAEMTEWEAKSRYERDFVASDTTIKVVFTVAKHVYNYVLSLCNSQLYPEGALDWCRKNAPEAAKELPDAELWELMRDSYYCFRDSNNCRH